MKGNQEYNDLDEGLFLEGTHPAKVLITNKGKNAMKTETGILGVIQCLPRI